MRNHVFRLLFATLLTLGVGEVAATGAETGQGPLVPVEGEAAEARWVGADATGTWTFLTDGVRRSFDADDVVRWGRPVVPDAGPVAVLTNGGLVPFTMISIDQDRVTLENRLFGQIVSPLDATAGLILLWPPDRADQDAIVDRLLQVKGSQDLVLMDNGDQIECLIAQINASSVQIEIDGHASSVDRRLVAAVAFNPAIRTKPARQTAKAWVGLTDGTLLPASRLTIDDDRLRITPLGFSITWATGVENCVFAQPLGGRIVYLSDRSADDYRQVSYLDLAWPYRNDRNVLGGKPRVLDRVYLKNLGVHGSARLTYVLDRPYECFEAELAIDDAARGGGDARCHVFIDGRPRWVSPPIQGGRTPVSVRINLTGAKRLDLIVDFGQQIDQLDYVDWLDARLVRPKPAAAP